MVISSGPKRVLESEEPAHEQVAFKHVVPAESRSFESQDQAIPNNVEGSFNGRDLDTIDSMNAVVDDEADTEQFFGSSSAGSFTRQIKKAIDAWMGEERQGSINEEGRKAVGNPDPFMTPSRSLATADASYTLPPRRQADYLMETYWTNVYPLYPFLDVQSWKASYEALYAGTMNEKHEQLFMATTNVIFAISAQLIESTSIDERDTVSNTFFQRAQSLLKFDPCDSGSVELVQNLLLTSQYLQSTSKPQQTWMVTGSAIRIAQSIGLHLPETSSRASNARQRELLRRLWYGCVLMDR